MAANLYRRLWMLDTKFDALTQVMDARLGAVDHRLDSLESDVWLIKQHLLSTTAA